MNAPLQCTWSLVTSVTQDLLQINHNIGLT